VRYLERMTGGARPDERVPMIVALHPMGGDPADFLQLLRQYRRRARLILPYGHPSGGMFLWYDSVRVPSARLRNRPVFGCDHPARA
jgi:phospholipase/carboxylesterase